MKLYVTGDINEYYVQTLCMIFFPGEKFTAEEQEGDPVMHIGTSEDEQGVLATARLCYRGKEASAEKRISWNEEESADRTRKIAIGYAVLGAAGEVMHYRPSWGMLTGVRPSKVAMEYLRKGHTKAQTRKLLSTNYMVLPKKASLAIDVARREQKLIGDRKSVV